MNDSLKKEETEIADFFSRVFNLEKVLAETSISVIDELIPDMCEQCDKDIFHFHRLSSSHEMGSWTSQAWIYM